MVIKLLYKHYLIGIHYRLSCLALGVISSKYFIDILFLVTFYTDYKTTREVEKRLTIDGKRNKLQMK